MIPVSSERVDSPTITVPRAAPSSAPSPERHVPDPDLVFEARNLNVYYAKFLAVRDVNLDVRENEVTALIGPSGCGKSTMLRCFNRMNDLIDIARVEGTLTYHGIDLYDSQVNPVEVRRRIGMVFQKPNPFPKSIYENVAYGPKIARMKGDMDDIVEQSLRQAALWDEVKDRLKASANGLSGGQQQRLCIARALAVKPDVVLMDEPCSALDPVATLRIEQLMQELKDEYTIVIVTHIGLAWQSSPALTEVEEVVTDWMRQMLGLSSSWSGVINDTASTSSLVALICARERATNYGLARGGLQTEPAPLVVYASTQSHSSVEKAALMAGFGRAHIRMVPHDASFAMRPDALAALIHEDVAAGRKPCAVVATVGTTTSTGIDPVAAITEVAQQHDLWVHVDAAMAGSAMILPECRSMWDGVERADSLIVNAHKWLGAVFDCTLYFVRDPEHLVRVMSTHPSYLQSAADGRVKNYRDWGLPLGRRFRALKLWFLIREQGVRGLQARLRRDLANAKWLDEQIGSAANWKVTGAGATPDPVRAARTARLERRRPRRAQLRRGRPV